MKKRYLFIDAYNVIHATKALRKTLDYSLDSARDQLAERVMSIHNADSVHTVLVLDSQRDSLEVSHPLGKKTFELVYAPGWLSADGVIERLLTRISEPADVTVASNDAMVREAARVNGAVTISANELFDWVCACEKRLTRTAEQRCKANEKEWKNGIDLDG